MKFTMHTPTLILVSYTCRAAYVCGRETNSELPGKEKQELEGLLWEEFLDFPTESELEESKLCRRLSLTLSCVLSPFLCTLHDT